MLRNASQRKCIGHPTSAGTESVGTVGSHGQTEFSAARELLRLQGQPYQIYGEDNETFLKRTQVLLTNISSPLRSPLLPVARTVKDCCGKIV